MEGLDFRKRLEVSTAILQASSIGYPYTPQLMAGKATDVRLLSAASCRLFW
jgi:hypothetical protein